MQIMSEEKMGSKFPFKEIVVFAILLLVFYVAAYPSVSSMAPNSIPVHHDDYSNYSMSFSNVSIGIRPLSTLLIAVLATVSPDALIWTNRFLSVLYVFLCWQLFAGAGKKWSIAMPLLVAIVVFSSPIVVEYARYTGMATHLLSGCLGIAAALALRRSFVINSASYVWVANVLITMSVLAKEDFLLLYIFSYAFFCFYLNTSLRMKITGGVGIILAAGAFLAFKFLSASEFLGAVGQNSTYFLSVAPSSIARTYFAYLSGGSHPATQSHGLIVLFSCSIAAVCGLAWMRRSMTALYLLGCGLAVIAPYSLLPNHVNSYYEFIWWPFIVLAFFSEILTIGESVFQAKEKLIWSGYCTTGVLVLVAITAGSVDMSGRRSIGQWYDSVQRSNGEVLTKLRTMTASELSSSDNICVLNADSFSPWYMHGGNYLSRVMLFPNKWTVYVPENSDLLPGFKLGADMSAGRISVTEKSDFAGTHCARFLDLKAKQI